MGSHSLFQGIFRTQRSNLGLLHCRKTLYHLSHQGPSPVLNVAGTSSRWRWPLTGATWHLTSQHKSHIFLLTGLPVKSSLTLGWAQEAKAKSCAVPSDIHPSFFKAGPPSKQWGDSGCLWGQPSPTGPPKKALSFHSRAEAHLGVKDQKSPGSLQPS